MLLPLLAGLLVPVASCQSPAPEPSLELGGEPTTLVAPAPKNIARDFAPTEAMLARRRALARSGRHLYVPGSIGTTIATAQELVTALDVPSGLVASAVLQGPDIATQVFNQWGTKLRPRRGGSFAVLSTGAIGITPEPGTDMAPGGELGDDVTLRIELDIPRGFNRLSFDYNFLSAESPDFVGSAFNDTFTATLIPATGPAEQVVLASVNDSDFFDASDALADGTGFDIFTPDPADVDDQFPGGLPDAGITNFQTHSFELPAAGRVSLVLNIRDLGDGILDSAVVIDNLRFSFMETVDLNAPGLLTTTGVSEDPAVLLAANQRVRGVVADGVTQILLRTHLPGPGQVEYALQAGTAPADGRIGGLNDPPAASSFTITAQEGDPGAYHAFAVYTAPMDFNRGGDSALDKRPVTIRARFTPDDPTQVPIEDVHELVIHRPPLVVVHGLWDLPTAWRMPILTDTRFAVHYANYNSATRLATNALTVPSAAIRSALTAMRGQQIAATQVDIVAHSIGGILVRQHLGKPGYRNADNFGQGDVHKLITLNTPHRGAQMADAIMEMMNALTGSERTLILTTLNNQGLFIDQGGIDDMQTTSPAITALEASGVPSHAIVGFGGRAIPRDNDNIPGNTIVDSPALLAVEKQKTLYTFVEQRHPDSRPRSTVDKLKFVFGNESAVFATDHDMFAEVGSQSGGIQASAVTSIQSHFTSTADKNFDSIHFVSPRADVYSARIVDLLNTAVTSPLFGEFPANPGATVASAPPPPAAGDFAKTEEFERDGLTIVSPTNGTQVTPGTNIQVTVAPDPGVQLALLGVITQTDAVIVEQSLGGQAVSVTMPIAATSAGPIELLAFGFDTEGNFRISNLVVLEAVTSARLLAVYFLDRSPFLFGIGASQQVTVLGLYDDGLEREITSPAAGTTYLSSNPGIFTVSAAGVITATGVGRATLVARNGLVQDSVTVEVKANTVPRANAGSDIVRECLIPGQQVAVTLDGAASFDPDGDPLAFAWFESGLSLAGVVSPTVSFTAGSQHTVDLFVSDGQSLSVPDSVSIDLVLDSEPPVITVLGADPVVVECRQPYTDPGAVAIDFCSGDLSNAITADSVDTGVPGLHTVRYRVADQAGNPAVATRSVLVDDSTPPTVQVDDMLQFDPYAQGNGDYIPLQLSDCAQATDTCGGALDIDALGKILAIHSDEADVLSYYDWGDDMLITGDSSFAVRNQRDTFGNGRVYEIEFQVSDEHGNASGTHTCSVGIKVFDDGGVFDRPVADGRVHAVRSAELDAELGAVLASSATTSTGFGTAVALRGQVLAISAPAESNPGSSATGAVYVYEQAGSTGQTSVRLGAPASATFFDVRAFGRAIALGDGVLAVSAENVFGGITQGVVLLYEKQASGWVHVQTLRRFLLLSERYGTVLGANGDTITVADPGSPQGAPGVLYFYRRHDNGLWVQKDVQWATDAQASDGLGSTLAMSEHLLVAGTAASRGSAYVFGEFDHRWFQVAAFPRPNPLADEHGVAVATSGEHVLVGAPADSNGSAAAGAVYVYRKQQDLYTWSLATRLAASDAQAGDRFGRAVAFDGTAAVVTASRLGPTGARRHRIYVFERSGNLWREATIIEAPHGSTSAGIGAGAVTIGGDQAQIGDPGASSAGVAGAAYLIEKLFD